MQTTKKDVPVKCMTLTIRLDSHSWVELERQNARLYYLMDNEIKNTYDGKIEGLPESVLFELEDMGAIKAH